jgi:predicted RNA-binding protein associated with RNAse of E/G family
MSLHRPRLISSIEGLGLNTTKTMQYLTDDLAIGTEIWDTLEKPWQEGEIIIAQPGYKWVTRWETGKPYIINKFYDDKDNFIAFYCDVARPVRRIDGGFEFDDLYLDIWQPVGQPALILDDDELQDAVEAGYVTQTEANEAQAIGKQLEQMLENSAKVTQF